MNAEPMKIKARLAMEENMFFVTKSDTAARYFLTNKSDAVSLLAQAQEEAASILKEFKTYYSGNIGIDVFVNTHAMGSSVACTLTVNGEAACTYDPVDLCFLELNELMLKRILDTLEG